MYGEANRFFCYSDFATTELFMVLKNNKRFAEGSWDVKEGNK